MMRRITSAAAMAVPLSTSRTPMQAFSSNYKDVGSSYKRPITYSSRSGAHRRPERQSTCGITPTASTATEDQGCSEDVQESVAESAGTPQRNVKNNYSDLFKPRREPISFKSNFMGDAVEPMNQSPPPAARTQTTTSYKRPTTHAEAEDAMEDDVTRIYSQDEVRSLVRSKASPGGADDGVLKALDEDSEEGELVTRIYEPKDDNKFMANEDTDNKSSGHRDYVEEEGDEDEVVHDHGLDSIRQHPFFSDLIRRVERNAMRYRKEISRTGRYSPELVNDCVRPILQLTDFPFTTRQLGELTSSINPITLKSSLPDLRAGRRLQLYRSPDTDLLLDWSNEDFLRRRYESIHLSWECMDVVYRRFAWSPELISDRDCLLYFSAFQEYVELAEMETDASGRLNAVPITDPVERAERSPVPANRLLIRRRQCPETEPSVTESVRLMGTPALSTHTKRHSQQHGTDSVADLFDAVERSADEVSGGTAIKLAHGMDSVRSLRQAVNPAGRSVKEFSVRRVGADDGERREQGRRAGATVLEGSARKSDQGASFDENAYKALSSSYHKTKVDVAMLRRRLLRTDNADLVSALQEKLTRTRRDLNRISEELRRMRDLRRIDEEGITANNAAEEADDDGEDLNVGFAVPSSQPQYSEAPEFSPSKNWQAAEDDDDIDISKELGEYDAQRLVQPAAPTDAFAAEQAEVEELSDGDVATPPIPSAPSKAQQVRLAAMSRSEELALRCEELSLAAKDACERFDRVMKEKTEQEAATARRVRAAMDKVEKTKEVLQATRAAHKRAVEAEARELVEAKARAVEEELRIQRERRQSVVDRQREKARIAQREAQRALERQKEAEAEALERELELERKLQQVRAELRAVGQVTQVVEAEPTAATVEAHREPEAPVPQPNKAPRVAVSPTPSQPVSDSPTVPTAAAPTVSSGCSFMCTPEQYDGMALAANRLRAEVGALEKQMETEGDEDDETLMAVLAASRADLEELDDCILSVQKHAPWAAEHDANREKEERSRDDAQDNTAQRLQKQIEHQRFQINLLEKRMQHTTQRNVISKLEQGIVQARRDISRIRIEQDRHRRSGQDQFGLPSSISMAEALAEEVQQTEMERDTEAVMHSTKKSDSADASAVEDAEEVEGIAVGAASAGNHVNMDGDTEGENCSDEWRPALAASADEASVPSNSAVEEQEAHQIRQRLDSMLSDIQNLQESIIHQENSSDYDDEAVLVAMKQKLSQLLKLRDDVQRHLVDSTKPTTTPVASSSATTTRQRPVVDSGRVPVAMRSRTEVRVGPMSKRLRRFAQSTGRRHN